MPKAVIWLAILSTELFNATTVHLGEASSSPFESARVFLVNYYGQLVCYSIVVFTPSTFL